MVAPRRRRRLRRYPAARPPLPPPNRPKDMPRSISSKQPSVVLLNLVPDQEGRIRIPRAELKGKPQLRILAVDPLTTVLKNVALEDTPVETRELRLAAGLDPAKTYSEQKLITAVTATNSLAIADATTARFETCDTVAKAYRLLATLGGNPTWEEFSFIINWPDLDQPQKLRQYSKYACHELSFFLYHKDPEFFRTVIAPYLKNKKDKTFMDHWLLGDDLRDYLEPWRFNRLNIVEKILLAKRLADQRESITRDVRDLDDLIPPNIEDFNHRFDTAIQIGAVETEGGVRRLVEDLRRDKDEKEKAVLFGRVANRPASTAAPAAPAGNGCGERVGAGRPEANWRQGWPRPLPGRRSDSGFGNGPWGAPHRPTSSRSSSRSRRRSSSTPMARNVRRRAVSSRSWIAPRSGLRTTTTTCRSSSSSLTWSP